MVELHVTYCKCDLLKDKYLMDMDELFSQVDEKRKVSLAILSIHSVYHAHYFL